jgi:hypothetical protein
MKLIENCSSSFMALRHRNVRTASSIAQKRLEGVENPAVGGTPRLNYGKVFIRRGFAPHSCPRTIYAPFEPPGKVTSGCAIYV